MHLMHILLYLLHVTLCKLHRMPVLMNTPRILKRVIRLLIIILIRLFPEVLHRTIVNILFGVFIIPIRIALLFILVLFLLGKCEPPINEFIRILIPIIFVAVILLTFLVLLILGYLLFLLYFRLGNLLRLFGNMLLGCLGLFLLCANMLLLLNGLLDFLFAGVCPCTQVVTVTRCHLRLIAILIRGSSL